MHGGDCPYINVFFVLKLLTFVSTITCADQEEDCSLEELQKMFWEMAQEFQSPSWFCGSVQNSGSPKRTKWDSTRMGDRHSHVGVSGLKMYETRSY